LDKATWFSPNEPHNLHTVLHFPAIALSPFHTMRQNTEAGIQGCADVDILEHVPLVGIVPFHVEEQSITPV
jgi:hypothetical protein